MSSSRKRAAIQKAHLETDELNQKLMLAEYHVGVLTTMAEEIARRYDELLYCVGSKFPNETRHETALRYIQNAEQLCGSSAKAQS